MNIDPLMFWKMVLWGVPTVLLTLGGIVGFYANIKIHNIEKYMKSSQEIEQLSNAVLNWGDFNGGSRSSYDELVEEKNRVNDPLVSEKLKTIENNYTSATMLLKVERLRAIWKTGSTPENAEWEPIEGYNAGNIVAHLSAKLWTERARAAGLLQRLKTANNKETINKELLFTTLTNLMDQKNESSLVVSKMALSAYATLTGFVPSDVFDFDRAIKDWNNPTRKEQILKIEL